MVDCLNLDCPWPGARDSREVINGMMMRDRREEIHDATITVCTAVTRLSRDNIGGMMMHGVSVARYNVD